MNEVISWKAIVLIVAIVYLISPVDLIPLNGIDDLIVLGTALAPFFRRAEN